MKSFTYELESYKNIIETPLDIKRLLFEANNRSIVREFALGGQNDKLLLNGKQLDEKTIYQILDTYTETKFIDLSKESISEDVLLNFVKDGMGVEIKNNSDYFTFKLKDGNICCTINAEEEQSYYMGSSYSDFHRVKGEVIPEKFKSFKDIIDLAITKLPTKLELLQLKVDDKLNELAEKLDSPQTVAAIESYLKQIGMFHNYSFNNNMLLFAQAEKRGMVLERVASFNTWSKIRDEDGNRALIGKGERGLQINPLINSLFC